MGRWTHSTRKRLAWTVIANCVLRAAACLAAAAAVGGEESQALPPLVSIRDVLADINATARRQVTVRGVVTWRGANGLIVQDDSGGIWIDTPPQPERPGVPQIDSSVLARLTPGLEVEVHGWANRGGYSPNISPVGIRILGERSEPEPRPVDRDRFFSGADDCLRVTVRGVVQGFRDSADEWRLVLDDCGHRFEATVPKAALDGPPDSLVDAAVRLVGVGAMRFNTRGEFLSPRVLIVHAADIAVERPAAGSAFDAPMVSLQAIAQYSPEPAEGRRIRTQGTVTFAEPSEFLYLQEGTMGVRVETSSSERFFAGDRVEVSGFVDGHRDVAGIVEAVVRRLAADRPLAPIRITPEKIVGINLHASYHGSIAAPGDYKGCLVTFPARVVDVQANGRGGVVLLNSGSTSAVAVAQPDTFRILRRMEPGSEVMVTGIVREDATDPAEVGRIMVPRPFGQLQLLLRSAADVRLVRAPSWWKPHRLAAALAAVAMVAGIASVWVMLLRRQVTRQLAFIEKKLQAEAATEERHRIAREFHDTLEQDLAGISLRLDAAAHRAADERSRHVLEEQRGLLARLQSETHDFLWDLRDPARHDGSLLESLAAQVAYLRSLTTVPIRFDAAGDLPRVPSLVQYQLLRIMREAVNNALKHADAAAIEVRVASGPDGLCLTVTDDGIGFDVAGRELLDGHFGIRGIRERARRIGAKTAIESHSGRGTHVAIVVPPSRLVGATESALSEPTMATAGAAGDHGHTNAIGKP
jgi:signal transduction histidine kinase